MRCWRIVPPILGGALIGAVILGLHFGCSAPPKEPLRIGVNAWPPFELLFLAQEKGFLKQEGVRVDLVDFSSYTGILRSYHQGNIDGFFATLNEIMITENFQDVPAVVLLADYSYGADAMVARDGVERITDLRGRKIAYEESGLGSYVLERALEISGLAMSDVTAINKLPDEGAEAFRRHEVDAVITYEPDLARLLHEKGAHLVFTSKEIPGEIVDVLALRRPAIGGRSDEIRRILRAWFKALDEFRAHPRESAEVMARRQNISVEEFLMGLGGAHIPDLPENRQLLGTAEKPGPIHQTVDRLGRFLVRHGLAKSTASGTDLFHPEFVESL